MTFVYPDFKYILNQSLQSVSSTFLLILINRIPVSKDVTGDREYIISIILPRGVYNSPSDISQKVWETMMTLYHCVPT